MNTLKTLYFPDTTIYTDRQFPLFLFFSSVHIIQPVEEDETTTEERKLTDTFMDMGICQVHTPFPLGEDRKRFLHLINDIKNRKDDYAAQLSALTVASMSSGKTQNDGSKGALISTIMGNTPSSQEKEISQEQEKLWQARLVLKIGEILDQEEEEVAQALTFLDDTELDLFGRLHGKDEDFHKNNPYKELLELKKRLNQPRRETITNRVRAWSNLLPINHSTHPLWLTTRAEAADIILVQYEKQTGKSPLPFFVTELPATTGKSLEQCFSKITAYKQETKALLEELDKNFEEMLLKGTPDIAEPSLPHEEKWQKSWQALLETHFPKEEFGRLPLTFYLFPNQSLAPLLADDRATALNHHGILAHLG